jgi:foldase protein PrsA
MKKKLLIMSLCGLLIVTGCGTRVKLKNGEKVVASVKGYKVTAEDLYEKLSSKNGETALISMIDEYIANKEVKDNNSASEYADSQLTQIKSQYENSGSSFKDALANAGYSSEKQLKNELALEYKKNEVVKKYLRSELSDKEIKDYYDNNIFGTITARHILIKPNVDDNASEEKKKAAEEKALNKAKKIIKELDNGAKFTDLVKKYSDDKGSKNDGGLISNFTKDSVVSEFFEASNELKNGEYTKTPVKSEYGYHVILKVSSTKKPSLKSSLDDIKDNLVESKMKEDSTISTSTWVKVRKKYKLSIADDKINSEYKKSNK